MVRAGGRLRRAAAEGRARCGRPWSRWAPPPGRSRSRRTPGTDTLVDEDSARVQGDRGLPPGLRRRRRRSCWSRRTCGKLVLTKDLRPLFELETCLAGGTELAAQLPRREKQPLPAVCDEIAELAPEQGRLRAGDLPLPERRPDPAGCCRARSAARARRPAGGRQAARAGAPRSGRLGARAAAGRAGRRAAGPRPVPEPARAARAPVRDHLAIPRLDDPNFVSRVVFDQSQAGRHAQGALRLPLPERRRGADHRSGCGPT